jgi:NTE family protein
MPGKRVLVLGGGAPNLTLMSGALAAFHDHGLTFDVISMAGGGAVVGLSYLAPKGLTPAQALRNTMNFGVSDAIYSLLPLNYKIFFKGGALSGAFRNYLRETPPIRYAERQYGMSPAEKLESDLLLLAGSVMTPTDTNFFSQAICAHVPFIEDIVDFDRLNRLHKPRCFLNVYSIDAQKIVEFEGPDIDIRHFRAAFSFPFLYAPYEIDGRLYYEGAAFSCLNLVGLARLYLNIPFILGPPPPPPNPDAWKFILFDVLGTDLIHPARDIMDAYAQSMIVPVIANAERELSIFTTWVNTGQVDVPPIDWALKAATAAPPGWVPNVELFTVRFLVPPEQRPYMLDWSRSNLERLFDIGYQSGLDFLQEYAGQI